MDETASMRTFVTLATTRMSDETLCIAGIDPERNQWIRPVEAGNYYILKKHRQWFPNNKLIQANFQSVQVRSKKDDPYNLHSEDSPINDEPNVISVLTPPQKLHILEHAADTDLVASISENRRSMFLIHVHDFKMFQDHNLDVRLKYFTGGDTDFESLTHYLANDLEILGISSKGIPCRIYACNDFISTIKLEERIVGMDDLLAAYPNAQVYFAFSLSSLYKDKHWMILAGIHVIGDEIWL